MEDDDREQAFTDDFDLHDNHRLYDSCHPSTQWSGSASGEASHLELCSFLHL